jgi:hypothetical protein
MVCDMKRVAPIHSSGADVAASAETLEPNATPVAVVTAAVVVAPIAAATLPPGGADATVYRIVVPVPVCTGTIAERAVSFAPSVRLRHYTRWGGWISPRLF